MFKYRRLKGTLRILQNNTSHGISRMMNFFQSMRLVYYQMMKINPKKKKRLNSNIKIKKRR
jgi:hypothetical protein